MQKLPGSQSDDGDDDDPTPEKSADHDIVELESVDHNSKLYITFVRVTAAMGFIPRKNSCVVDRTIIDTEWNVVSSVGLPLLPAIRVGNMQNVQLVFG